MIEWENILLILSRPTENKKTRTKNSREALVWKYLAFYSRKHTRLLHNRVSSRVGIMVLENTKTVRNRSSCR